MEYLGWECSAKVSSWWSNQQCEIGDLSDLNYCGYNAEGDIFNPIQQLMIHKRTSVDDVDNYPINFEKLVSQMVQHLAPPLDSITIASTINSWQHEQCQETMRLASANNMVLVAESGAATSWGSEADLRNFNSPNSIKMMPDNFGILPQDIKAAAVLPTTTTASMESLDCLLSATNSNAGTTTAHQDDGINSILFSQYHCKNSISSGDSRKDDHKHLYHEIRPNSSSTAKRSNNNIDECQIFQGEDYCSNKGGGFQLISPPEAKKARLLESKRLSSSKKARLLESKRLSSTNINFQQPTSFNSSANCVDDLEPDLEAIAQMKEMIYIEAAFRPVKLGEEEVVEKPRRKNVKISSDPQTAAARQRRERISEKIRVLQRLVPGGTKMDTASMLDEAANYLKFLRSQVKVLETLGQGHNNKLDSFVNSSYFPFNHSFPMQTTDFSLPKP